MFYLNEFMYFRIEESKRSKLYLNYDWYYVFFFKVIYKYFLYSIIGIYLGRVFMKCL